MILAGDSDSNGTVHPRIGHYDSEGEKTYSSTFSLTSALDRGGLPVPHPGCYTLGNNLVPIVEKPGWAHPAFDSVSKKHTKNCSFEFMV